MANKYTFSKTILGKLLDFRNVQTTDEARKFLKEAGYIFYIYGALILLAHLFYFKDSGYIDGLIYIACAYAIKNYQSRFMAILLNLLVITEVVITYIDYTHLGQGGHSLVIGIIVLLVSLRATQVCFNYHRLANSKIIFKNALIKNVLALIYGIAIFFIGAFIITYVIHYEADTALSYDTLKQIAYYLNFVRLVITILVMGLSYRGLLPFTKNKLICVIRNS